MTNAPLTQGITSFGALAAQRPLVVLHLVTALLALLIGIVLLNRRKGTPGHRALGWAWVLAMGSAAASSALLRDTSLPNIAGITPIHAFTVLVAVQLPRAVLAARRGRIEAHRRAMRGLFFGGCVVAGLFTLTPGRFLGHWLGQQVGLIA